MARMKCYALVIGSDELFMDSACGGDRLRAVFQKAMPASTFFGYEGVQMFLYLSPFERNRAFDEARVRFVTADIDMGAGILDATYLTCGLCERSLAN